MVALDPEVTRKIPKYCTPGIWTQPRMARPTMH
jgi:hypothetical protein